MKNLKYKPHIILVTETWLDRSLSGSYVLDNYHLEVSSQHELRGKGAAIYIDNSIPYSRRGDLESNTQQYQSVFIELNFATASNLIVGAVYRSPSFPAILFLDFLDETLETISREHKPCSFGGDFNFDILKANSDDSCSQFVNLLASHGFLPCISLPTRVTSHSSTLIDNFFL